MGITDEVRFAPNVGRKPVRIQTDPLPKSRTRRSTCFDPPTSREGVDPFFGLSGAQSFMALVINCARLDRHSSEFQVFQNDSSPCTILVRMLC